MFNLKKRYADSFYYHIRRERRLLCSMLFASTSEEVATCIAHMEAPNDDYEWRSKFSRFDAWNLRRTQSVARRLLDHLTAVQISPKFREQCLAEMIFISSPDNGASNTYLDNPDEDVLFTVICRDAIRTSCVRFFLASSIVAETTFGKVCPTDPLECLADDSHYSADDLISVVRAPRWVYRVIEHTVCAECTKAQSEDIFPVAVVVGQPVPTPNADVLACALALWDASSGSPYQEIGSAVHAAQLLA